MKQIAIFLLLVSSCAMADEIGITTSWTARQYDFSGYDVLTVAIYNDSGRDIYMDSHAMLFQGDWSQGPLYGLAWPYLTPAIPNGSYEVYNLGLFPESLFAQKDGDFEYDWYGHYLDDPTKADLLMTHVFIDPPAPVPEPSFLPFLAPLIGFWFHRKALPHRRG